ncbi:MAG: hypothetical protein KJ600_02760 [Nanoarchaeota archaeon]|nr:hypothetical protein [Nanoarchaeota archaeon]
MSLAIALDCIFTGTIFPLYPFSTFAIGLNIVNYLPQPLDGLFLPSLDAILLFLWLAYLEIKHKVSDFI